MIVEAIRIILGLAVALYIPGYLIVRLWFKEFNKLESIAFSITFSIMVDIAIAIFLGYNEAQAARTGGLNFINIVILELLIIVTLLILHGIDFLRKHKLSFRLIKEEKEIEKEIVKIRKPYFAFLQKHKDKKGLFQFIIRSAVFFAILFGFQLFLHFYFRFTHFFITYLQLPQAFYFDFLTGLSKTDFINSTIFTVVIFLLWNRKTILKLQYYKRQWGQTAVFALFAVLSQVGHYIFKYYIRMNMEEALHYAFTLTIVKYMFDIYFIVFLLLAIFNVRFFIRHFFKFRRQIPVFTGILVGYFLLIKLFQFIWAYLGNFVARAIYFIISLTFDNAYLNIVPGKTPSLGIGTFIVGISRECSGIDSLLLFISLFSVLVALDWKRIHHKRMVMLFIPGLLGTVLYNILRIYLLLIVGVYISPEFAVNVFHSNIGWILFLGFFVVFWHFGSRWVYRKDKAKKQIK